MDTYVHSMDEHKRHEMDKMDDMFGMQYSISVENQPYPVLCTLSADGCTTHVPDFPKKSLSRFARNTVDALTTIRSLKVVGVAVYFQKENINTMDGAGEFLITLMGSFAEEESRSISENVTWAVRH